MFVTNMTGVLCEDRIGVFFTNMTVVLCVDRMCVCY